jgi:hypothetical protein
MWNPEDEASDNLMMKSELNATPRVLPFDQVSFGDTDPLSGNKASQVVYYDRAY